MSHRYAAKRLFDLALTVPALLVLSPLYIVVAILVALDLGRPVLFRQVRPGRNGQPFAIYKFRTMTSATDAQGQTLPDAARLTRLGCFLRRTSLDELPELANVLSGQMSLVGPRPLLMEYLPFFTPEETRRFLVPPGITGWAQINGRNRVEWDTRLAMDVWYIDHRSMRLDLKILALTLAKVLTRENAVADTETTESNLKAERSGRSSALLDQYCDISHFGTAQPAYPAPSGPRSRSLEGEHSS